MSTWALDRLMHLTSGMFPSATLFVVAGHPKDDRLTVVRCTDEFADHLLGLEVGASGPLVAAIEGGRPVRVPSVAALGGGDGEAGRLASILAELEISGLWLVSLGSDGGSAGGRPIAVLVVCDPPGSDPAGECVDPTAGLDALTALRDQWADVFANGRSLPSGVGEAVAASVPDAVIVVDRDGHVTFVNEAALSLLGLEGETASSEAASAAVEREIVSLRFEDDGGESYDWLAGPLTWVLDGGGVQAVELREVSRRPQRRLRLSGAPFGDHSSPDRGAVVVVRDLTALVGMRDRLEGAIEVERRRTAQLRALNQFAVLVNSETDPSRILDEVLGAALRLTRSTAGAVYVPSGADLRLEVFVTIPELGEAPHGTGTGRVDLKEIALRVAAGTTPVRMAEEVNRAGGRFLGYLGVPLVTQAGGLLACVVVVGSPDHFGFTAEDEVLATTLAAHAGVALENLQRLAREREVAHYLQRAMLPRDIEVPGILVDHAYESATDSALVGGDFYDVVPLSDRRVAVMVGDVCGKGLPAATFMSFARHTLKAQSSSGLDAGGWLDAANLILASDPDTPSFVTVALALIDTTDGNVELALAGHPAPLVVTGDEVVTIKGIHGLPLGVDPSVRYATSTFRIDPHETLCLHTDGLLEARQGDTLFGEGRLRRALAHTASGPLEGAAARLVDEVTEFAGGRLVDDVVVLLVRLTGDTSGRRPRPAGG